MKGKNAFQQFDWNFMHVVKSDDYIDWFILIY